MTLILEHIDVSSNREFDNHKTILKATDPQTGMRAFIAVHDTTMGPALGGCRYWSGYASEDEAITDVLRLSRGMTYKNALARLDLGGGKAVIMGKKGQNNPTREEMVAFGQAVESLKGDYITAEDVGISVEDMIIVKEMTDHVTGLPSDDPAITSGDPSPYTAYGVFLGIQESVKQKLKKDDLSGVKVAVAGLGHVGMDLCRRLHEVGAELYVSDIRQDVLDEAVKNYGATIIAPEEYMSADVDVLAPCALGGMVNDNTIDFIKASIIAGAANNQLDRPEHGKILHDKGILYAPDYVINAAGVISVAMSGHPVKDTNERIDELGETLGAIFRQSERLNMPTSAVADKIAEKIIEDKVASGNFTEAPEKLARSA
ncbi:MAG: Leu/Phe/Val dehydrogenase [Alphaproteobacteria bacterium]